MTSARSLSRRYGLLALSVVLSLSGYLLLVKFDTLYVATHSLRQNLVHLGATDACMMYPIAQVGNLVGPDGHSMAPAMTIYLVAPKGRRPKDGDMLELLFPRNLAGKVRFTQATNNGYGGSGSLEWVGEDRKVQLGMAIWDFTLAGSLQYQDGGTGLWGDCKKEYDLNY